MTATFLDHAPIQCSACGDEFHAPTWLVVDASTHAELIRENRLFFPCCPTCGHIEELDYPLLLYLPNADPCLIFSPPPGWEQIMVQDQVAELVESLREPLGVLWREDWLTEGLPVLRQSLLASAVEQPASIKAILHVEELLAMAHDAMQSYLLKTDLAALDQAVALWDSLWSEDLLSVVSADFCLCILNDGADAHLQRYWAAGDETDLDIALAALEAVVDAAPKDSPDRPARLSHYGVALSDEYARSGNSSALDKAVGMCRQAVDTAAVGDPNLGTYLNNLGTCYSTRYSLKGSSCDLDQAVSAFEQSLSGTPSDSPNRIGRLNNLANVLMQRYESAGKVDDLDAAIQAYRECTQTASQSAAGYPRYLSNLASALSRRLMQSCCLSDIDEMVDLAKNAVDLTPQGSPERPAFLINYLGALLDRYSMTGQLQDIEETISIGEDLPEINLRAVDVAALQHNLGKAYFLYYQVTGKLADIIKSVDALRRAVSQGGESAADVALYCDSLANALSDLCNKTGEVVYLREAIQLYDYVAQMSLMTEPDRSDQLSNRGGALHALYQIEGDPSLLDEAIAACRASLVTLGAEPVGRHRQLSNLAAVLRSQYQESGAIHVLEEVASLLAEAVETCPVGSPERHVYFNSLGNAFSQLFERTKDLDDFSKANDAYRQAISLVPASSPHRSGYLDNLGNLLSRACEIGGDPTYLDAAIDQHRQALACVGENKLQRASSLNNLGVVLLQRSETDPQEDIIREAVSALSEATRLASTAPQRAGFLANLGQARVLSYRNGKRNDDLVAAMDAFRRSCLLGLATGPAAVLQSAHAWSAIALEESDWAGAVEASQYGIEAAQRLYQSQLLRQHKRSWLHDAAGIAANGAYALARLGQLDDACLMLERDRARLMAERLDLGKHHLDDAQKEDPDLHQLYVAQCQRLRWLQTQELANHTVLADGQSLVEALKEAYGTLTTITNEIKTSHATRVWSAEVGMDDLLHAATIAPIIYVVSVSVGGMALWLSKGGPVNVTWLEDLTSKSVYAHIYSMDAKTTGYLTSYRAWRKDPSDYDSRRAWRDELASLLAWINETLVMQLTRVLDQQGIRHACLVPHGMLALLPLHAATSACRFTYLPSARLLNRWSTNREAAGLARCLALQNPRPDARLALPLASLECERMTQGMATGNLILAGKMGTRERVLGAMQKTNVWHFATHGEAQWDAPLDSRLLLAGEDDIRLRDFLSLQAEARLAVLSACETGIPDEKLPDEVVSLAAGLLQAGADCVVSSLWAVEDLSTALLMRRFYGELLGQIDGCQKNIVDALSCAQCWLRHLTLGQARQMLVELMGDEAIDSQTQHALLGHFISLGSRGEHPFEHPYYWAGMCVTGNGYQMITCG